MFLYHQAFTVSFRLSAYHPLGQDFLSNELCRNDSKSVCTLGDNDEVESIPKAVASHVPPPQRRSRASQDVSLFNVDAVIREVNKSEARMTGQVFLDKVLHTPFEGLHYLKGDFDSLYDLINERGSDETPSKNQVKKRIQRANDLKDLQESYFDRMTFEVRESC